MSFIRRLAISLSTADPLQRAEKLAAAGSSSIPAIIATAAAAQRAYITAMGELARRERTTTPRFDYADYARLLGTLERQRVVDELIAQFRSKDSGIALNADNLLSHLADPLSVDPLLGELDGDRAFSAVGILGATRDRRAVEPLLRLLERRPALNARIAGALGRIGDPRAVPAVIEMLRGSHAGQVRNERQLWEIRQAAAEALGKIGDRAAVPALIEACNWPEPEYDAKSSDAVHAFARFHTAAVQALEEIGDSAAVPALLDLLWRRGPRYPSGNAALEGSCRRAATALGKIGDDRAVDSLLRAAREPLLHKEAVDALASFDDRRAQDVVAAARAEREVCFVCGKSQRQTLLPKASAEQKRRAGGDAVVASMVAYVESIEDGTAGTSKCNRCGRWACTSCVKSQRQYVDCPSCASLIRI